jgi:hypothetical protein
MLKGLSELGYTDGIDCRSCRHCIVKNFCCNKQVLNLARQKDARYADKDWVIIKPYGKCDLWEKRC